MSSRSLPHPATVAGWGRVENDPAIDPRLQRIRASYAAAFSAALKGTTP